MPSKYGTKTTILRFYAAEVWLKIEDEPDRKNPPMRKLNKFEALLFEVPDGYRNVAFTSGNSGGMNKKLFTASKDIRSIIAARKLFNGGAICRHVGSYRSQSLTKKITGSSSNESTNPQLMSIKNGRKEASESGVGYSKLRPDFIQMNLTRGGLKIKVGKILKNARTHILPEA